MKIRIAYILSRLGNFLHYLSDCCRSFSISRMKLIDSSNFERDRYRLQKTILGLRNKNNVYFQGHPYQSLGILNIFGDRSTEDRFDEYRIPNYIGSSDIIIDLGCNCGFLLLYTCFRTGARGYGIDHDKNAIEIGKEAAKILRIENKVNLEIGDISKLVPTAQFTCVFSMATYWTDDEGYRVDLSTHLNYCGSFLASSGILFFETHAADFGSSEVENAIKSLDKVFEVIFSGVSDHNRRNIFVLRKLAK